MSQYRLKTFRIVRSGIVVDCLAVAENSAYRNISEIGHRIVELSVHIDRVDHQAGTIGPELPNDLTVRLDEAGRIRGIIPARIRHAHPKMICRRPALHRLAHDVRVHTRSFLAGVVKGLENTLDLLLIQFTVKLREP